MNQVIKSVFIFIVISWASTSALAAPVIYSITSDEFVLNNPNGTWAGDLNIAADQNVNLTVEYRFEGDPGRISGNEATFFLEGLQVFDNTNGLASAFIVGSGSMTLFYDGNLDHQTGADFGIPGGSFNTTAYGEFGEVGDPLPTGRAFDRLVERNDLINIIARAPDYRNDNISGLNGIEFIPSGNFSFQSRVVPIPATVWLFGSGLIGWIGIANRRRA